METNINDRDDFIKFYKEHSLSLLWLDFKKNISKVKGVIVYVRKMLPKELENKYTYNYLLSKYGIKKDTIIIDTFFDIEIDDNILSNIIKHRINDFKGLDFKIIKFSDSQTKLFKKEVRETIDNYIRWLYRELDKEYIPINKLPKSEMFEVFEEIEPVTTTIKKLLTSEQKKHLGISSKTVAPKKEAIKKETSTIQETTLTPKTPKKMSKPKLKTKKKVVVPKGTQTIEISFRETNRKGKIKGASKVKVPRTATTVVVKPKKQTKKSK